MGTITRVIGMAWLLAAAQPGQGKILSLDVDRMLTEAAASGPSELAETLPSHQDYQTGAPARFNRWLEREELETLGPLTLGLVLLALPLSFPRKRITRQAPAGSQSDGGNSLRRIDQSWDPRF